MSNVVEFPRINGAYASGRSMPGLTTPELRIRARDNYYSELRHQQVDPLTADDLADGYLLTLERISREMGIG
jgi:hypothetical protein